MAKKNLNSMLAIILVGTISFFILIFLATLYAVPIPLLGLGMSVLWMLVAYLVKATK